MKYSDNHVGSSVGIADEWVFSLFCLGNALIWLGLLYWAANPLEVSKFGVALVWWVCSASLLYASSQRAAASETWTDMDALALQTASLFGPLGLIIVAVLVLKS